jgi:hypothetical protein
MNPEQWKFKILNRLATGISMVITLQVVIIILILFTRR